MPFVYYLNALFDLELQGEPIPDKLRRSAAQMECLFFAIAKAGDRVLIENSVDESYLQYLRRYGVGEASSANFHGCLDGYTARVWGWNHEAVDRLNQTGASCIHPPLDVVKRVNERFFCHALGKEENLGVPGARRCLCFDDAAAALSDMSPGRKVIKARYGTAGRGFVWVESMKDLCERKQTIDDICVRQGGVIIEPWLDRIIDIGSIARIKPDGKVSQPRHHRNLTNRAGTFYGDWIEPFDPMIEPWREYLDKAVFLTARRLFDEGYWGVFGCDTFLYRTKKGIRPAAVFEINARYPMSVIAYGVKDRLAPNSPGLFRFISKRKHHLPHSYDLLEKKLGAIRIKDSEIVLLTPVRLKQDNGWIQPARSAFYLFAPDPKKLAQLDTNLRAILSLA